MNNYLYLIIIIFVFIFPFLLSFDKKVYFYKRWKFLFPSILLSMMVFIPWDIIFTDTGIWGFNPMYLSGLYFINLPIEEVLFFVVVPYACVFIYDVLKYYHVKNYFLKLEITISITLSLVFFGLGLLYINHLYTSTTFLLTASLILLNQFVFQLKFLSYFYQAYLLMFIPFLLVNSVLTGSFIPEEIVWYNDLENLSIRLFTIPVEDIVYGFMLIMLNLTFYTAFEQKSFSKMKAKLSKQ